METPTAKVINGKLLIFSSIRSTALMTELFLLIILKTALRQSPLRRLTPFSVRIWTTDVHQMDITRTPVFSKAALPWRCGCDVKTEPEGQGTQYPDLRVFLYIPIDNRWSNCHTIPWILSNKQKLQCRYCDCLCVQIKAFFMLNLSEKTSYVDSKWAGKYSWDWFDLMN